jgi:hypothetical protein
LSAVRFKTFDKVDKAFGVVVFADALYLLSGLLNVILYAYTRPNLQVLKNWAGPERQRRSTRQRLRRAAHDDYAANGDGSSTRRRRSARQRLGRWQHTTAAATYCDGAARDNDTATMATAAHGDGGARDNDEDGVYHTITTVAATRDGGSTRH